MLTRRRFLAAAAAAAVLPGCGTTAVRRRRLVVVGAGLAGLITADVASRAGWDVTVLEGADRVGGRVLTERPEGEGRPVEHGGEYVDVSHEAMLGLARRYALGIDDVGPLRTPAAFAAAERRWSRALDSLGGRYLDRSSAGDVIERLPLAPAGRAHLAAGVRRDYGIAPEDLSLLFVVRTERLRAERAAIFGEGRFRVRGGADLLPNALARELGDRVELGARVTAIAQDDRGVTVSAGGDSLRADACVLAAPLPALRDVAFAPALPAVLARAVAQLQYASITKAGTDWPAAWVAYAPGQVRPFLRVLRRPVGRIVLAGEHTAELSRTMEGAVRAGRTAARQIEHL